MVTERNLSTCSKTGSGISDEDQTCGSVATSDDVPNHNTNLEVSDTINDANYSFGNIILTNSNDVHFRDKNLYQGPVTIEQFLYVDENSDRKLAIKDVPFVISNDNIPNNIRYNDTSGLPFESSKVLFKNLESKDEKLTKNKNEETNKCNKWLKKIPKRRLILILSLIAVLIISLTTLLSVILIENQPNSANRPVDTNRTQFVKRSSWGAKPPKNEPTLLILPVPYVIISHTASGNCSNFETCKSFVKNVQFFHVESRDWDDIGYNFLVGGDGNAYEGRGWKAQGAHTYGYNSQSIGISFIGTFNDYMPTAEQIERAKQLIQEGVDLGYIDKNYKLFAARQLQTTQSPGLLLYQDMKTWPHWTKQP